jgi:hypothetical protein
MLEMRATIPGTQSNFAEQHRSVVKGQGLSLEEAAKP